MSYIVKNVCLEEVWRGDDPAKAERAAIVVAVNSGRTSYLEEVE